MDKKIIRTISIVLVCFTISLVAYQFLYSYLCKHRVYTEISEKISEETLSANIDIIQKTFDGESTGYSTGFGGVIFKHSGNKYYAITAHHAVDSLNNFKLIVLAYNEPTLSEYISNNPNYIGVSEYYKRFPFANIEYYDKKYDLAILSFESYANLKTLHISGKAAQYGDKVAAISSPYHEERNMITYGKITSRSPVKFNDQAGETQHKLIKHSAYINKGSSGSVLMNMDLEIVGINLGGGANILGNFGYGMAMPSDKIIEFISQWDKSQ